MQVTDMVRSSVDSALRQLMANGGGTPTQPVGYQHPARTKEELLATKALADGSGVPADQQIVTDGMSEEILDVAQGVQDKVIPPKEDSSGWKF